MTMTSTTTETRTRTRTRRAPVAPVTALPEHTPLVPKDDQAQQWIAHASQPVSFDQAVTRVLEAAKLDGARADQVADLRAWGFGSRDGRTMEMRPVAGIGAMHQEPIALRRRAFRQLAERAGVPAEYVATLPPMLQVACMNWGMAHAPEGQPALLRTAGGDARALLSDRYAAFDDQDLLEVLDDVLFKSGFRSDAMVRSTVIGPHMVLRVTVPSAAVAVKQNDVIEWGLDIANSELGMRSVQITPVTYRLLCTNGMRGAVQGLSSRIRHVGDKSDVRDDVRALVPTALAEARGDLDRWRRSVDQLVTDALAEVEGLRSFGLSVGETRAVGRRLAQLPAGTSDQAVVDGLRGLRSTTYDVCNAITETARDRADVAARLSLEETAHRHLTRRVG